MLVRQENPVSTAAQQWADSTRPDTVLAYDPVATVWKDADDVAPQRAVIPALPVGSAYAPLAPLLRATRPDVLGEARRRIAGLGRPELTRRYRSAYAEGKRLVAYLMAYELIERGIPPCFWHEPLALDDASVSQRADLVLADLAWLRRWHPDHVSAIRYKRGRALLTGSESVFIRETEFAFYQGKRPHWRIVSSMSMTERQQWEAAYLRSTPIKKAAEVTRVLRPRVQRALRDDLRTTRRTTAYGDVEAAATLDRRIALWDCSRIVKGDSPTEIAMRYQQMTGIQITRQAVAKQLEKVCVVLSANGDDFTS